MAISRFYSKSAGWALGCKHIGTSHKRSNMPCQDDYCICFNPPYIIIAVADGHGNEKHNLSQYGASLAVKAASDTLSSFYKNFGIDGSLPQLKDTFRADFPRRVTRRWRKLVIDHARQHIREVELLENQYGPQEIYTRYGTTLLAGIITSDIILLGQIGDGDVLIISSDGSIETVFKKYPSMVGNETYSLSSQDAHELWQTAVFDVKEENKTILMATDGLSNSFADDNQFQILANSLLERIKEFGLQDVSNAIPRWFDEFSARGSGDDITVVVASVDSNSVQLAKKMQSQSENI